MGHEADPGAHGQGVEQVDRIAQRAVGQRAVLQRPDAAAVAALQPGPEHAVAAGQFGEAARGVRAQVVDEHEHRLLGAQAAGTPTERPSVPAVETRCQRCLDGAHQGLRPVADGVDQTVELWRQSAGDGHVHLRDHRARRCVGRAWPGGGDVRQGEPVQSPHAVRIGEGRVVRVQARAEPRRGGEPGAAVGQDERQQGASVRGVRRHGVRIEGVQRRVGRAGDRQAQVRAQVAGGHPAVVLDRSNAGRVGRTWLLRCTQQRRQGGRPGLCAELHGGPRRVQVRP